jgi:ABC transport permease subunit
MRAFTAALDLRRYVGRWSLRSASHAGRFSFMLLDLVRGILEWRVWLPRALDQTMAVGYGSMFIVLLVAGFAGAVTSLQAGYQFTGQLPLYVAGGIISESMILELGPVLTGLILAGRIGARYAAELGSMRVTEQIDALESLGRSPVTHLLLPRIIAVWSRFRLVMLANAFGVAVVSLPVIAGHICGLRVRRTVLLPAARLVLLGDQVLRVRRRGHHHSLLHRLQHAAGR